MPMPTIVDDLLAAAKAYDLGTGFVLRESPVVFFVSRRAYGELARRGWIAADGTFTNQFGQPEGARAICLGETNGGPADADAV